MRVLRGDPIRVDRRVTTNTKRQRRVTREDRVESQKRLGGEQPGSDCFGSECSGQMDPTRVQFMHCGFSSLS